MCLMLEFCSGTRVRPMPSSARKEPRVSSLTTSQHMAATTQIPSVVEAALRSMVDMKLTALMKRFK